MPAGSSGRGSVERRKTWEGSGVVIAELEKRSASRTPGKQDHRAGDLVGSEVVPSQLLSPRRYHCCLPSRACNGVGFDALSGLLPQPARLKVTLLSGTCRRRGLATDRRRHSVGLSRAEGSYHACIHSDGMGAQARRTPTAQRLIQRGSAGTAESCCAGSAA